MANLNVKTSFNTKLQFNANSMARRIVAYVLDVLVMALYVYVLVTILDQIDFDLGDEYDPDAYWISRGWIALLSLPIIFYTLVSEVVSGGYTLGKYAMGIKVVKIDGFQPTFVEFFIRWIFRVVDIYSVVIVAIVLANEILIGLAMATTGMVGIIAITASRKGQRLGDQVAGTTVIRSKLRQDIKITILQNLEDGYKPMYPQVVKLSDNDARIIKETYENAVRINDTKLMLKLVSKIEDVIQIKNTIEPKDFIRIVLKDFNYYTQNM